MIGENECYRPILNPISFRTKMQAFGAFLKFSACYGIQLFHIQYKDPYYMVCLFFEKIYNLHFSTFLLEFHVQWVEQLNPS